MRTTLALLFALLVAAPATAAPALRVDADRPGVRTSALVTGVDQAFSTPGGEPPANWSATLGLPDPTIVAQTRTAGVGLIRFPGGAEAGRYAFKAGIGTPRATCQYSGTRSGGALSNVYGFDEHMRFVQAVDAEAEVVVPFAFETAHNAADWVEYANAPVGANPNGGIDWARVRADNGHPEPYGVERWQIGHAPDRRDQRYWLGRNDGRAIMQYLTGGTYRAVDEPADAACRWSVVSSGRPGQRFRTRYAPVRPPSFVLAVGQDADVWRRVRSLAAVGPRDKVYTLDEERGVIAFGDGVRGAVPPASARIFTTYRSGALPGYDDFRRAMRAVDPTIDVCATWSDARFLRVVRRERRRIDCLAAHPYTTLSDYGRLLFNAAAYDAAMKGAAATGRELRRLRAGLRRLKGRPFLAVADYGALPGSARLQPGAIGSMIHAMYMATQQQTWLRTALPWATGGRLTDFDFEIIRGRTRLSPAGEMRRALGDLPGRRLVRARITDNPSRHGYPSVRVLAARSEAGLTIVALNRNRDAAVDVRLVLEGFTPTADALRAQVTASAFDSPDATYAERTVPVRDGTVLELPPHSLTRLELR